MLSQQLSLHAQSLPAQWFLVVEQVARRNRSCIDNVVAEDVWPGRVMVLLWLHQDGRQNFVMANSPCDDVCLVGGQMLLP